MTVLIPRMKRRSRYLFEWAARDCLERNSLDALSAQAATFARTTGATSIGSDGGLAQQTHSQPAYGWYDLDGDTVRETPVLLLRQQRTNALTWSRDLSNAAWAKVMVTAAATAIGADGYGAASTVLETNATGLHFIARTITITSTGPQATSVWVKAAGRTKGRFNIEDGSGNAVGLTFDLGAGTVANYQTGSGSALLSPTIERGASGWYRLAFCGRVGVGITSVNLLLVFRDGTGAESYLGDTTKGMLADGWTLEQNWTSPSGTIQTTSGTVTRNADTVSFPFNAPPQPLTLYQKILMRGNPVEVPYFAVLGDVSGTGFSLQTALDTNNAIARLSIGGANTDASIPATVGPGDVIEHVAQLGVSGLNATITAQLSVNGAAVTTSGTVTGGALASAFHAATLLLGVSAGPMSAGVIAVRVAAGARTLIQMREGA